MAIGVGVTIAIYLRKKAGLSCSETDKVMYCGMIMYSSYLVLFVNFFYHTYVRKSSKEGSAQNGVVHNGVANGVANGKKSA